jgi:hypothetical protein
MKKTYDRQSEYAKELADVLAMQEEFSEKLDVMDKMSPILHDMIKENWQLKKELYALKKEKAGYHKNLDEIELYIKNSKKRIFELESKNKKLISEDKNFQKLKNSLKKVCDYSAGKNPLKKAEAYKKMIALYHKLKQEDQ